MAKRSAKTAKPTVALKLHAFAKPRATPITLEPAIHFPLPAGQNPGDPYYGKDWLNPRDPADYGAALKKLGSAGRAVGAGALVLHWADWVAKADEVGAEDRAFVERSRDLFVHATAALDALDLSEEARQAIDLRRSRATFQIGEIKATLQQALHARKDMPRARSGTGTEETSAAGRGLTPRPGELGFRRSVPTMAKSLMNLG